MNIWQILQIEPTTDLREIKKAYAKRSIEVHPEEKPEEFSILYEAYQNALNYAKMAEPRKMEDREQGENSAPSLPVFSEDFKPEIGAENNSNIFTYFSKRQVELQKKIEEFQKQWDDITKSHHLSPVLERWVAYLQSEDFKNIRLNPQVLELLEQKIEMIEFAKEPKLALWDAYGFQYDKRYQYYGAVLRLFDNLVLAYEIRKQKEREEKELTERIKDEERNVSLRKPLLKLTLLLVCLAVPFFVYLFLTAERRFVATEMKNRYSTASFTKPKKTETLANGSTVYTLSSQNNPALEIRATVFRDFKSKNGLLDDYGLKLLQHYGELYGLEFDLVEGYGLGLKQCINETYGLNPNPLEWNEEDTEHNNFGRLREYVVFYSSLENADSFCDSLFKFLEEVGSEELSFLDNVGICWANALYPEVMFGGGIQKRPFRQIYIVEALNNKETLKNDIEASYVEYMYNYEAWNLTQEQLTSYGSAYVSEGREARMEEFGNPWCSDIRIQRIEEESDLFIPIYEKEFYEHGATLSSYPYTKDSRTWNETYITIGNAYQLLKAAQTEVHRKEDGSGFTAVKEGKSITFGDKPELELSTVMEFLSEPEAAIE